MKISIGKAFGLILLAAGTWIFLNSRGYLGLSGVAQYGEYGVFSFQLLIVGIALFVIGMISKDTVTEL